MQMMNSDFTKVKLRGLKKRTTRQLLVMQCGAKPEVILMGQGGHMIKHVNLESQSKMIRIFGNIILQKRK